MGTIEISETTAIVISTIFSTFTIGWIVFGVRWIKKSAKSLSNYQPIE